ncbi:MAG: hypothetical protein UR14_C0004G0061 [candidate division TM6 bacterium GW2011_GWE2_31_21]|nr:MAG: hypothetical protein UR14_C0004G0061 [candidate division TM6 bacterium GW2011_GWE2_31_21]KKP52980.1 MAG: hypothetical protein UR43_C0008G0062 [candidate division TM6 bacterium GW2011_GWF2_33_332]
MIPNEISVICDCDQVWLKKGKNKFCSCCFDQIYFFSKNKKSFLNPNIKIKKKLCKKIDAEVLKKVLEFFQSYKISDKYWTILDLHTKQIDKVKDVVLDFCSVCSKREILNLQNKIYPKYAKRALQNFSQKLSQKETQFDLEVFKKKYLAKSSPYSLLFATFCGSGLENDFLKDSYLSTLLAVLPAKSQQDSMMLCGGHDKDEKIAAIKAVMEFVERYALRNLSLNSPIFISYKDEKDLHFASMGDFKKQFKKELVDKKFENDLEKYTTIAIDVTAEKAVLIPLQTIFNSEKFLTANRLDLNKCAISSTSNGFAAHSNFEKAAEKSVLELVERDAFIRWWSKPENCIVLKVAKKLQKEMDLIVNFIKDNLNVETYIKFLLLSSPLNVPVVLAYLSSSQKDGYPAIIVGASADFDLESAKTKAFSELKIGILNFIARFQKDPKWLEKGIDLESFKKFDIPEDHFYFYQHPEVLPHLKFLKVILNSKSQENVKCDGPKNFDELKVKVKKQGFNWYLVDTTPKVFEKSGVFVVRSFIPQLYPLYFGAIWPFDMKCSKLSVASKFPHCFP